jgi:hypothetical protein
MHHVLSQVEPRTECTPSSFNSTTLAPPLFRGIVVNPFGEQQVLTHTDEGTDPSATTLAKYTFNVESQFASDRWSERFLVEVHALSAREARHRVAANLHDFERITSPVLRVA